MAYKLEPNIISKFLGIRQFNGVNSGGIISAINAQNVELIQSDIGAGTGIKTALGNSKIYDLPIGYKAIDIFSSVQDGAAYLFIYAENDIKGTLFYINHTKQVTPIVDDLSLTGKSNGITMTSTAYDVFVFTNGKEKKTVCFAQNPQVKDINAIDYQGRQINWLSMVEWKGFLVVASDYGVHASHQNDIYTWNDNPLDTADSWFIDFSKKVTAVCGFSTGLFIFTDSDVTRLIGNPNSSSSSMELVSMNGTLNHQSFIVHDTYLFFFDPKQKNIYYMEITDTGQTRPAGPIAREIQSFFSDNINKLKIVSCIYSGNNEIWVLINDYILIFNYTLKEWTVRKEMNLNSICLHDNSVISGQGSIYVEKINSDFDNNFYKSEYKTTFINLGSNSNLKKQKTPILIVLNDNDVNDFWVELTCNNKQKNPKKVKITNYNEGVFGDNTNPEVIPKNETWGEAVYSKDNPYSKRIIEISTPQTWYTLGIRFYTSQSGQGFSINSIEFKNIKAKTKTRGR